MVVVAPSAVEHRFRFVYLFLLVALAVVFAIYFGWGVVEIILTKNEPSVSYAQSIHMTFLPTFAICEQTKQARWAFAEMHFGKKTFPQNKLVPTDWYNPEIGQQVTSNDSWTSAPTAQVSLMTPKILSDRFSNSSMFQNCVLFHPPRRSPSQEFQLEKGQRFLFKAAFESDGSHAETMSLKLSYLPSADIQQDQGFLTALEPWNYELDFRRDPNNPSQTVQTEKPVMRTQISIKQSNTEILNFFSSNEKIVSFESRQKGSEPKLPSLLWTHPLSRPCQPGIVSKYCSPVTDMRDPKLHWIYAKIFVEEDVVSIVMKKGMWHRLALLAVGLGSYLTLAGICVAIIFVPKYPLSYERRVYDQLTLRFHDSSETHDIRLPLVDEKDADQESHDMKEMKKRVSWLAPSSSDEDSLDASSTGENPS